MADQRLASDYIPSGLKGVYFRLTSLGVVAKGKNAEKFTGRHGTYLCVCLYKEVFTEQEAQEFFTGLTWFGSDGNDESWLRVHDAGYPYWIWARFE